MEAGFHYTVIHGNVHYYSLESASTSAINSWAEHVTGLYTDASQRYIIADLSSMSSFNAMRYLMQNARQNRFVFDTIPTYVVLLHPNATFRKVLQKAVQAVAPVATEVIVLPPDAYQQALSWLKQFNGSNGATS